MRGPNAEMSGEYDLPWKNKQGEWFMSCKQLWFANQLLITYLLRPITPRSIAHWQYLSTSFCSVPASPDLASSFHLSCDTPPPGVSWSPSTTFTLWVPLQGFVSWNYSFYTMCAQSIPFFVSLFPLLSQAALLFSTALNSSFFSGHLMLRICLRQWLKNCSLFRRLFVVFHVSDL